jgi:hypothetical protein
VERPSEGIYKKQSREGVKTNTGKQLMGGKRRIEKALL